MKHFLLVLALLALLAATCVAQPLSHADSVYLEQFRGKTYGDIVPLVWLDVCALNRSMYPDSNLVQPGDVILLPLNRTSIAKADALQYHHDHMWGAAEQFTFDVVTPYLFPIPAYPAPQPAKTVYAQNEPKPESTNWWSNVPWWAWVILVLIVIIAAGVRVRGGVPTPSDPPFLATPPDLHAPDSQVLPVAEQSLRTALGRGFQIIGVPERGTLNGEQTTFFADGTHRTETYSKEPGFRARVRFDDGTERQVVCRWSCFNPCWGAKDAKFKGTFTPQDGKPQDIPVLNAEQTATIALNIQRAKAGETVTAQSSTIPAPPAPETPAPAAPKVEEQPTVPPAPKGDGKLRLTKVQFSLDKGINLEGDITVTMEDLMKILGQVQGKSKSETAGLP